MKRMLTRLLLAALTALTAVASGCTLIEEVAKPAVDEMVRSAPNPLEELAGMVELLEELGLPDLGDLADLPALESLPFLQSIPGGIVYRGTVERRLEAGDRLPGTDIVLVGIGADGAEFRVGDKHSVRKIGDSLDFDGEWAELEGVPYSARLRIYQITDSHVRVAGVQQLGIPGIRPSIAEGGATADAGAEDGSLRFPFAAHVGAGQRIAGTTYGYGGTGEAGARLTGMAEGEYAYRKIGDSLVWRGELRPDIAVEYNLRTLHFDDNALQVAGVVTVWPPLQDQ